MKKIIPLVLISAIALQLAACTTQAPVCGKEYSAYGIANEDTQKNPNVNYDISLWNVIMAVVFSETVVVPVVVLGWELFVPSSSKTMDNADKGVIGSNKC